MMKILFVSGQYPPQIKGGGEISTHLIVQGLKERGHEVRVIAEGGRAEEGEYEGIMVRRDRLGLTGKPLFENRRTKKIAVQLKAMAAVIMDSQGAGEPWVVHAHDFRSAMAVVATKIKNPVVTIRDYAFICGTTNNILVDGSRCHCTLSDVFKTQRVQEAGWMRGIARAWQYWYNVPYRKRMLANLPRQVFISQAQMREIDAQLPLDGVQRKVIFNPIPDAFLEADIKPGISGEVLFVGRVEDYKGVGLLIEAWGEVVRRVPEAHLTIIGEGAQKNEYERRVAKKGLNYSVKFEGFMPWSRMKNEYDKASVVVAPHRWIEPFGRTVAEGMARGKVVVAAKAGGATELIIHGRTGLLFQRDSAEELRENLHTSLTMGNDRTKSMGQAARKWIRDNLTKANIAAQYEQFYRQTAR